MKRLHSSVEICNNLRVSEIDPQRDLRWQVLMHALPDSLIYHHPAWLHVLQETYGYRPVNLACEDSRGQLRGILPLCYKRGLLTGRRFSSLPHTPVAGPLAYDDQAAAALVHAAVELVRDQPGAQLQLKTSSNSLDDLVDGVIGTPSRLAYRLELPGRPELLRFGNSRNHAQIKRAVNKAARLGVDVSLAETERELRSWYELYLRTMRRLGLPARPYHFFEVAWRQLQPHGLMQLFLARHYQATRVKLLAGSLFFSFGQTVFFAFNGWRLEDQALRPNDAIHWQAIQDACTKGFRYYDFGEVDRGDRGLAGFKSKWGALPGWLYRYYYPHSGELDTGLLEADSHTRQLAKVIWQRLPLKATVLLSNFAYHYL